MKDGIILVETFEEATELGWTQFGGVDIENCWQGVGYLWCKKDKFAILNNNCEFVKYISKEIALKNFVERNRRFPIDENEKRSGNYDQLKEEVKKIACTAVTLRKSIARKEDYEEIYGFASDIANMLNFLAHEDNIKELIE